MKNYGYDINKKNAAFLFILFMVIYFLSNMIYMPIGKEIQAFYISTDTDEYTKLRYDLLKTIVYAKVKINADGSLTPSKNYNPAPLIKYAHNRKSKVVLMFQGEDDLSIDTILENQKVRTIAINNLVNEVKKYEFDGIDIDLENPNITNSINGQPNKELMTDFVTAISDKFRAVNDKYRISIDIGFGYNDTDEVFDLAVLQDKVDYIMIMGYDQYGPWSSKAGPNTPMRLDNGVGIYDSIQHYTLFVKRNKLILGVPWYGYEFATESDARLSQVNGDVKYVSYENYVKEVNEYTKKWDSVWQTPWYTRKDNKSQWYQIHYDDVKSLGIKYDLVNSEEIAGIGIWTVNYGSDNPELWQLIQDKFRLTFKVFLI